MTREELKEHCKKQIQQFERVEKIMPVTPNDWKRYEEHKLILELLEQTKWIPVSESLPEVMDGSNGECSDDVLICVADDEQITISTGFYGYYPQSKLLQGWWSMWACGCHQLDSKYKVIAWMPLPEPYKAENEETETWNGIHTQITAPKGTFERIFINAVDEDDI